MRDPILIGILVGVMCVSQAIAAAGGGGAGSAAHSGGGGGGGAHFSGGHVAGKSAPTEVIAGKETRIARVVKLDRPLTDSDKKKLLKRGYAEYHERGSTYLCSGYWRDHSGKVRECMRVESPNAAS
jgi:hypothetical protein